MMNNEKTKVLFAEVDSNLADVILSFLTLPLGTIVRILEKHYGDEAPVFGSLTSLYKGLANLDDVHFWTEAGKLMLLNPRSSFEAECRELQLNIDDTEPSKYFFCNELFCNNVTMYYGTATCPDCNGRVGNEIRIKSDTQAAYSDGVFTNKRVSFVISDDLRMVPNDARSFIETLQNLGITDAYGAEQRAVTVGFNDIMDLLKGSLLSRTPLTDLILHKKHKDSAPLKSEPGALVYQIEKKETSKSDEKMIVKVIIQKSTNRFLFAQAEEDFVDFLFSFLTIPLAGVECLSGSNSSLHNIDKLYRSLANLNKYLLDHTTSNLVKPKLPRMYLSNNHIFPLGEQTTPELYYSSIGNCITYSRIYRDTVRTDVINPKGQGGYVRGPGTYLVTDDLTVTPLCLSSRLLILNGMKIKLSDVKEEDIYIGLEEALSILKASLTSAHALSNGLGSIWKKQPKQEY